MQWVAQRGLACGPFESWPECGYFQFVPQRLPVTVRELICALMDALGGFSGGLLLLTDWIWDDEYDADPTAGYRAAINESRSLGEVPGFLFAPDHPPEAPELMRSSARRVGKECGSTCSTRL